MENYPRLQELFLPLARCIKSGNLKEFDEALKSGEDEFVKRRIYLTLERGRDIALRNLLRKVFIAGGYDEPKESDTAPVRRTRIPVTEFQAAISMSSGQMIEGDEVECLLANMIYKVSCSIPWCTRGTGCLLIPALPFFGGKRARIVCWHPHGSHLTIYSSPRCCLISVSAWGIHGLYSHSPPSQPYKDLSH